MPFEMAKRVWPRDHTNIAVVIFMYVALAAIGADLVAMSVLHLDLLHIYYCRILRYAWIIGPAAGIVTWLILGRGLRASIVGLIVGGVIISLVCAWADSRPLKVRVKQSVDGSRLEKLEVKLGCKILETSDGKETVLEVDRTPGRADRVKSEMAKDGNLAEQ